VPVERIAISSSQLCELVGIEPERFIAVEPDKPVREGQGADKSRWWIVVEPDTQPVRVPRITDAAALRRALSQVDGLIGVDPKKFVMAQTSGTFPQLTKKGTRIGKKGGKRGC
jgi:hypothetical protein